VGAGALALLLSAGAGAASEPGVAIDRSVVLLLVDGLAPEVVDRFPTPTLDRMRREGAWTHQLEPVFPSVSLTNSVSLSTGCYPEKHGIVSNRFWDPARGIFAADPDADWLTGCEHLHQAAERQGLRTAAVSWVGARSKTRGAQASIVSGAPPDLSFCDGDISDRELERGRELQRLLRLPTSYRPRLLLGYF